MSLDISEWLRGLGLGQYEPAFRDNDIDGELLLSLTAEDLRDLGVASIGHRRRLLNAIAALNAASAPAPAAQPTEPISAAQAERRQLTVVFVDLVGSTALSVRFDPEDLREIVGAYHRCVADTIGRFGGFVAKYMGDGVLIYFGYPRALEDDAERAVMAGLALIAAVAALPRRDGGALACRVGIATGLVVVGDLLGSGAAQEQAVVGETPNLAARLQALAAPDSVLIGEQTCRVIGKLFELEDLGPQSLAGFPEPQPAWRVLGPSGVVSRFEALRSQATPLVGRDEELDLLLRRWQQAKAGEGRVVLVSGEAGIGKSRLTAALAQRLLDEPHTRLRYFCLPHHQDSALHPFITQLERAAGFARDDTAERKLARLRDLAAPAATDADDLALLAELLSLPNNAAVLNLSPQRKRERLFEALLRQLAGLARARPVLMVFEDAHWIDPTSRELLDLTLDRVTGLPVLLVVTFRSEFQHGWAGQPQVTVLALPRLTGRDGAALVGRLAGDRNVPNEVVREIVERTDGVPLFVEELTKAVLESGDGGARMAAVLAASPQPGIAIPATLHASLTARLDHLGPGAREVAQIGAVLGRDFGYDLIARMAPLPERELRAGLDRLVAAGLLFCRGIAPQASYQFKHALVQDAAYGTLLRARRQELHSRAAMALEGHFADFVERQPEALAHHLTAAGETERAVDQWLMAGRRAAEHLHHIEALGHFERGLALLAGLAEGSDRDQREMELRLARGLSLLTTRGFAAPAAAESYARAHELAERRGDTGQLFRAVNGLWQSNVGSGRILECRRLSNRLEQLTSGSADDGLRLQAHHAAWTTFLFAGEPAEARRHIDAGRRLYDPERHHDHRGLYGGHDPGACSGYMGAQAYWLLGYPDQGLALGREGLALAERIAHPLSLEVCLLYNAMLHLDRDEPELALQRLAAAEALAAEQRLGFAVDPQILHGAVLTAQGALDDAVACLRDGLVRPGAARLRPYGLLRLAEALARLGEHAAALGAVNEGLEDQECTGQRRWEPELRRLEGIALLGLRRRKEGLTAFETALDAARRQRAKSYELRAATALSQLLGENGQRAEALDLLAPVYDWFTEGFDTKDLKRAKMLLDMLI
ncbi:MAG TPA: AAA family ATPase [Stellaceae bacterium]|nr:AAA family ATPase [Stellaceae bacterium]